MKTHRGKGVFGNNDNMLFSERETALTQANGAQCLRYGCLAPLVRASGKNEILAT